MKISSLLSSRYFLSASIIIWLLLLGIGFHYVISYHAKAGERVLVPLYAIEQEEFKYLNEQGNSILCFLHPLCPCSKTTVAELELLTEHTEIQTEIVVVFPYPMGKQEWLDEALVKFGDSLRKSTLIQDPGGVITAKFGVVTSGHTLVYQNHQLIFSGGLTPARGHAADSWSRVHLENMFQGSANLLTTTPCYGCKLYTAMTR